MLSFRLVAVAALSCSVASQVFAQSLEDFEPECVTACVYGFEEPGELDNECDCHAVQEAMDNAAPGDGGAGGGSGGSPPSALVTARDLILDTEAAYNARMAGIDNYYIVQQSAIEVPAELLGQARGPAPPRLLLAAYPPAAAQTPPAARIPMLPSVRFFEAEMGADGGKSYGELTAAELAARDPANAGAAAFAGDLADGLNLLVGRMPDGVASRIVGPMLRNIADRLMNLQLSFGGQRDGGFAMALEKRLVDDFVSGSLDAPVYLGWYRPPFWDNRNPGFRLAGQIRDGMRHSLCLSQACGATTESAQGAMSRAWAERQTCQDDHCRSFRPAFVIRIGDPGADGWGDAFPDAAARPVGPSPPRQYQFEGETYEYLAELWLIDASEGATFTPSGPSRNELVVIRRRMAYSNDSQTMRLDRVTAGYEREEVLSPTMVRSAISSGPGPAMTIIQSFFRKEFNLGPPTQEEVARLIAQARAADWTNDPLATNRTDYPTVGSRPSPGSDAPPGTTGQDPILNDGQEPPTRDPAVPVPRRHE